eukprot:14284266-Heterocapsa_arctica.AAC.1
MLSCVLTSAVSQAGLPLSHMPTVEAPTKDAVSCPEPHPVHDVVVQCSPQLYYVCQVASHNVHQYFAYDDDVPVVVST